MLRSLLQDDPDPSILWAVPPVALLYVPIVATNATTWALAAVHLRWWTIFAIACYFSAGLLAASCKFEAFSRY